jgi:hypothetical protein
MDLVILGFVALYLVGLFVWLVRLSSQLTQLRHEALGLRNERDEYKKAWSGAIQKLGEAQRQLIALGRQVPGRDNSGRFTPRPKGSEVCGSE